MGDLEIKGWDMAKEPSTTAYMIVLDGQFRSVSKAVFDRYERMRARTLHRRSGMTESEGEAIRRDWDQWTVPYRKIKVLTEIVTGHARDPRANEHIARQAVREMADRLAGEGYVTLRFSNPDDHFVQKCEATLGVVSAADVMTMQERVAEHQEALANEVVEEGVSQINNWGSDYGQRTIEKDMAIRFVREALQRRLG